VQTRLQKILSAAGISSRRASEAMILEGRVSVNGKTVTELGSKADPDTDDIRVDGRRVKKPASRRYILMYKPRGYITSRSDPEQRPTVIDLLAKGGVRDYVYPVGRLDYESEGLLILTSDGDLAERLMHPSHEVGREYHVRVRGVPDEHAMDRLARGIVLDSRKTAPAKVEVLKVIEGTHGDDAMLSIEIHEGRNRQVRRMCEAVGHPVVRLRRVRIGPIHDEHIRPGEFRDLDEREVAALKRVAAKSRSSGLGNRGSSLVARDSGVGLDRDRVKAVAPTPANRGEQRAKLHARSAKSSPRATSHEARAASREPRATSDEPRATARRAGSPKSASGPRTRGPRPSGRPRRG
jgi:23S rRNA pseudouridine2605 synthase